MFTVEYSIAQHIRNNNDISYVSMQPPTIIHQDRHPHPHHPYRYQRSSARFFLSFVNLILFEQIANKHQSICDFEEVGGGEGVVGDSQGYRQIELVPLLFYFFKSRADSYCVGRLQKT